MAFISRKEWGARAPKSRTGMGPARGVTIHYEGPRMGTFGHDKCPSKVRGIQAFHMDTRKWADIAYTAIVCPHGDVFICRDYGTRTAANGTNAGNDAWYAVCVLMGEGDVLTDAAKIGVRSAVKYLQGKGAGRLVNGHRDHKATSCPGDLLYAWVKAGIPAPASQGVQKAPQSPPKPVRLSVAGPARRDVQRGSQVVLQGTATPGSVVKVNLTHYSTVTADAHGKWTLKFTPKNSYRIVFTKDKEVTAPVVIALSPVKK